MSSLCNSGQTIRKNNTAKIFMAIDMTLTSENFKALFSYLNLAKTIEHTASIPTIIENHLTYS